MEAPDIQTALQLGKISWKRSDGVRVAEALGSYAKREREKWAVNTGLAVSVKPHSMLNQIHHVPGNMF